MEPNTLSVKLQLRLAKGKSTLPKFLRLCAYWSLRHFDDLVPMANTLEKPKELLNYYKLGKMEKDRLKENKEFWNREDISHYLNEDLRIKNTNKDMFYRLKEMLVLIPNTEVQDRIKKRLVTFVKYFVWKGEMAPPKLDQVDKMLETFQGVLA